MVFRKSWKVEAYWLIYYTKKPKCPYTHMWAIETQLFNGFYWNEPALTEVGWIGRIPSMVLPVTAPLDNRGGSPFSRGRNI